MSRPANKSHRTASSSPSLLSRLAPFAPYALALLLTFIVVSPLLDSGFTGDDAANSAVYARSSLKAMDTTLGEGISGTVRHILSQGRIYPLSTPVVYVPLYFADGNAGAYKIYILAMVLLNVALFGHFVRGFSRSASIAFMAMLWLPLLIQFRAHTYHDPVLGFGGHLQVTLTMVLVSLIALIAYLQRGKRWLLVASVVSYGLAILTYEVALPLALLHLLVIWLYPQRRSLPETMKAWIPYAATAGALVLSVVVLRALNHTAWLGSAAEYSQSLASGNDAATGAYSMNVSPLPVIATVLKQAFAATPLSYALAGQALDFEQLSDYAIGGFSFFPFKSTLLIIGFLASATLLARHALLETPRTLTTSNLPRVFAAGTALLLLPNAMIALSPRYQMEIDWGIAYLPVYMSYFGSALLLAGLVRLLYVTFRRQAPRALVVGFSVLLALTFAAVGQVNFASNAADVGTTNVDWRYPRELEMSAAEAGLFTELPAGSTLLLKKQTAWETLPFFTELAGRPLSSVDSTEDLAVQTSAGGDRYLLLSYSLGEDNGAVLLGRVSRLGEDEGSIVLDSVRLYVAAHPSPAPTALSVAAPDSIGLEGEYFTAVSSAPNTGLFQSLEGYELTVDR